MKTLLRGGYVVSGRGCRRADVLIDGEKVEMLGHIPPELAAQSEVVDVAGCMLFPGFIDAHTHFDLDVCNTTTADDFESGSKSAISRFVSGKTDKISTEHLLRIAKVFEVSTDFLLGEVNTPDRTNFDIEELGLSVQAARNLYTGKANAEIVNRLLESPRFAEVTYMIEQYFDDTLAAGFAGQNQMLTTLSAMLRRNNKTDATRTLDLQRDRLAF